GGFIATPCTLDVSTPTCKNSPTALTAFCANRSANAGKNSFHSECDGLASIDDYRTLACLAGVTDTQSESRCPGLLATACLDTTNDGGKKPFQTGCSLAPDQVAVANAQRDACLAYDTFPDTSCQSLASVRMACEADPFTNTVCATRNDYAAIEGVFCATATGIATANCPNATSGDWVASLTLNTDPATATATNEFLQIAEQTISTAGTTKADDSSGEAPDVTMLNFSDISYDGASFSADDGLAYFSGYQGNTLYHYAGIFGSTDLGAPITESGFSATWIGRVSINATATPMYFTLAVTFDGTEGTVDGFIANITDTSDLLIDGTFAANGVLTGDVHYAVFASETTPETPPTFNGSLSGLIGTDGVVAAFISTATGTDGYAGGFIATPPVGICKSDVFDMDCPVREIITATTAFCTNITDNLGANPFNTGCIETTHGAVETAKRDACLSFATFPNVACQTLGLVRTACEADFFAHVGCATHNDSATIKATFCDTSAGIATAACPNATSGDWVASRTGLNTDPATTTDPTDTTPAKNEFLQIADKTISTMGTTTEANGAGEAPTPTTLDFSGFSYDGASLSADDGLAYFSGYQGGTLYYYAGIYGTTDLGAPITGYDDLEVTWPGMLRVNGLEMAFNFELTFDGTNTGTFDGTNGAEGTRDFIFNSNTAHWMALEGTFDENGVITGVAHRGPRAQVVSVAVGDFNGTLSGLISAEGAVAVFFGAGYSGGFVAAPLDTVNFGDWTRSFDGRFNDAETLLDSGADATGFSNNTARFITLNTANQIVVSNNLGNQQLTDPTILRLDSAGLAGQNGYESGIAFWHGDAGNAGSQTSQYYAGLLVGTDLGAPIDENSNLGAIWTGKIDGITNGDVLDETEVKFEVMFGGTTSFANSVGSIKSIANEQATYTYVNDTVGAVNVNAPNTGGDAFNNTFDFTGGFNAQGVITGTVAHTNSKPIGGGTVNGVFNGLIGVDGAVGVFKSDDAQSFGFIGGFEAKPPAE
nr:hypothetical protein [Pseudomonadota bacterium]